MTDEGAKRVIDMRNISKRFGRVVALDGVDFEVRENEIMGLVGNNGSGKSTLIKVLVGYHQPDEGEIYIRDEQVTVRNPSKAREFGIATVYQDLALVDELSVAANIFLARAPKRRVAGVPLVDWSQMNSEAARILRERLDVDIGSTEQPVEYLSGGERQAIAIARALATDPEIIILDEPTSNLSPNSADLVVELVKTLKEEGLSIILINHNLNEIFEVCDRITILDNGELVGTVDPSTVTKRKVVDMMVKGRILGEDTDEAAEV
jgi:ABC-type sugar transport system ATPase subunit